LGEEHERSVVGDDDLELLHDLRTLDELRALSDPLRLMLFRLLREQERTVKELCDLLGDSSTRLYYHVGELERVGLVRLVRTEAKSGIVQKYYRAVARFVCAPFTLFHDEPQSDEARAALDWYAIMIRQAETDLRQVFADPQRVPDPDTLFMTRNYIRTTPERARELAARIIQLQKELIEADDEAGPVRFAFTTVFAPSSQPPITGPPRVPTTRARREPRAARAAAAHATSARTRERHARTTD
jgi:DNA-binding transcriptional ArsR family regulator